MESCKYVSKLGQLYAEKQGNSDLDKVVFNIECEYEFEIRCGSKLPISSKPLTMSLHDKQVTYILNALHKRGCVVVVDSVTFTLTNLL